MKVRPTERMIIEATIENERRIEECSFKGPENALKAIQYRFPSKKEFDDWFKNSFNNIVDYLHGKFAEWNDLLKDPKQKEACRRAIKFLYVNYRRGYLDDGVQSKFDRMRAAIYILSFFVPGKHLGFTVSGSALDRYLLTMFGGTLDMCGKYGFGIRILEDRTPREIREYVRDVLGGPI